MADFIGLLFKLTCNPELETDVLEVCFEVWSFLLEEYTDASSSLADDDAQPPPPQLQSLSGFSFGGSAAEHSFKVSVAQARRSTLPLLLGSFKNLAPSLSRRLFFQFNAAQLSSLDDTPPSEGSHAAGAVGQNSGEDASEELFTAQSELDVFTAKLTRMLGNFAQINELGTVLLEHIAPQLRVALGNFQNRAKLGKEDVGRVLHDVTASLSLLCSVSGHFVHQFERHFVTAAAVFTALLELAKFCTVRRVFLCDIATSARVKALLIEKLALMKILTVNMLFSGSTYLQSGNRLSPCSAGGVNCPATQLFMAGHICSSATSRSGRFLSRLTSPASQFRGNTSRCCRCFAGLFNCEYTLFECVSNSLSFLRCHTRAYYAAFFFLAAVMHGRCLLSWHL